MPSLSNVILIIVNVFTVKNQWYRSENHREYAGVTFWNSKSCIGHRSSCFSNDGESFCQEASRRDNPVENHLIRTSFTCSSPQSYSKQSTSIDDLLLMQFDIIIQSWCFLTERFTIIGKTWRTVAYTDFGLKTISLLFGVNTPSCLPKCYPRYP